MGIASIFLLQLQLHLPWNTTDVLLVVSIAFLLYAGVTVFWRLFFHPLRKIPGPWLAAATSWYEFYQDVVLDGHYVKEYPKLHAKYGPLVRVSPDRVHVSDPEFFHEVYQSGTKYMKDPDFFQTGGGIKYALPMLIDPEYHKERRNMVKSLFSTKSIGQLSPIVLEVVRDALEKAIDSHENGSPLDIQRLFTGVTVDTIMRVLFDKQLHLNDSDEEEPPFLATMRMFWESFFLTKHFPILTTLAVRLPDSWAHKLVPGYAQFRMQVAVWIQEIEDKHKHGVYSTEDGRKTMIDLLLKPDESEGYRPLSKDILVDDAYLFCVAGTHTTSFCLSLGTYYLLRHPQKLRRLVEELQTVQKNPDGMLEYRDVCNLPYLTAVIRETLRLSSPVPGIAPRKVPAGGVTWGGHYLPPGTTVSIAIRMVSDSPDIFPEPESFIPERWLGSESLEHWLVVFSKGPRACLGVNVAYLEIYLCLANFFSRLDMSLYNTDEHTTTWVDYGSAMLHQNVKVTVESVK